MRKVKTLLWLLAASSLCLLVGYKYVNYGVIEKNKMYRLTTYNATGYQEVLTSNTAKCDLSTFSNLILDMEKDGYIIEKEDCSSDEIDLIMKKDRETIRMLYKNTGDFISIGNPYEKSSVPVTYISERVIQEN